MRQSRAILLLLATLVIAGVVAFALMAISGETPSEAPATSEPTATAELVEVDGEPVDPKGLGQDRLAQARLHRALAAAIEYQAENGGSYLGFGPKRAGDLEDSVVWAGDEEASVGVVSINLASDTEVVMSTQSESGRAFCVSDSAAARVSRGGSVDAHEATSAADCSGSWDGQ